jgi:hypothetical protein
MEVNITNTSPVPSSGILYGYIRAELVTTITAVMVRFFVYIY